MSTQPRDRLDELIDRAAAQLVSVDHDTDMTARIVERLPERPAPAVRVALAWLPRLALACAVLVAVVVWTRDEGPIADPRPIGDAAPIVRPREPETIVGAIVEPPPVVRRPAVQPPQGDRQTIVDPPDHERSLAAVASPTFLELSTIATPEIEAQGPVVVAPLALTELPLASESPSPR